MPSPSVKQRRPGERADDARAEGGGIAQVARRRADGSRPAARRPRRARHASAGSRRRADPRPGTGSSPACTRRACGQLRQVAGERMQQRIGDEIERAVGGGGAPRCGRWMISTRPARPRSRYCSASPRDLGVERHLGLALDEIGGREIDEDQQRQHRRREQREIERGEAEGVGLEIAPHRAIPRRGDSPRRARCAGADARSPCRSSAAGGSHARR